MGYNSVADNTGQSSFI